MELPKGDGSKTEDLLHQLFEARQKIVELEEANTELQRRLEIESQHRRETEERHRLAEEHAQKLAHLVEETTNRMLANAGLHHAVVSALSRK